MLDFFSKRLLPAVTLTSADSALRLAQAYLKAGLDVMEVTFRTDATLEAIEAVAQEFPQMNIGAGTILSEEQVRQASDAGARFGLSPGLNPQVIEQAQALDFPFIPGISTPTEIEQAMAAGCLVLKLFPAELLGGTSYIKAMEGPYGHTSLQFIPMGGIDMENMVDYLSCKSVLAVGGSWMAPKTPIQQGDFANVSSVIRETLHHVEKNDH